MKLLQINVLHADWLIWLLTPNHILQNMSVFQDVERHILENTITFPGCGTIKIMSHPGKYGFALLTYQNMAVIPLPNPL